MSDDPKILGLQQSHPKQKIVELNQQLQQVVNRLVAASPEAQNLLGQLSVWKEIEVKNGCSNSNKDQDN